MKEITATNFKARCLALLDDVAESGAELIITKRGRPVARVAQIDPGGSMLGTVSVLVDDDELMEPIGEGWNADSPPS